MSHSTLTIVDALPDGRSFDIRYVSLREDAVGASLWADALDPRDATEARKRRWLEVCGMSPDAPMDTHFTIWRNGRSEPSGDRAWLAHWRDELARINGTDSATAKSIIADAAWQDADLSRFIFALA